MRVLEGPLDVHSTREGALLSCCLRVTCRVAGFLACLAMGMCVARMTYDM